VHGMPDARGAPRAGVAGIVARWQPWAGDGLEHLVVHERPDGVAAESVVVADGFAARYRIVCDGGWRTRRLEVALVGAERGLTKSNPTPAAARTVQMLGADERTTEA